MQHFANKLWNIARFILANTGPEDFKDTTRPPECSSAIQDRNQTFLYGFIGIEQSVTANLERFALHEAAQDIYQFTWHTFADQYLEESKSYLADPQTAAITRKVLAYTLVTILKLLHPFMPFVTEEIWENLPSKDTDMLLVSPWPGHADKKA